jgi:hypothetical protein
VSQGSIGLKIERELGKLGQADTDVPLLNQKYPRIFEYHVELSEEVKSLVDKKVYTRG